MAFIGAYVSAAAEAQRRMYTTDYSNMTVGDIYLHTRSAYKKDTPIYAARAWVMAENVMEIRNLVIDWCNALENGSIKDRYPDPLDNLSQEEADRLIGILDDEFDYEYQNRASNLNIDARTELYARLSSGQRLAMAQAIKKTKLSRAQIARETAKRLRKGETLPLQGWSRGQSPSMVG